jgi:esterase FrsA
MPYTYPISPAAMFEDRADQFIGFGVPREDVALVQSRVSDMWLEGPGGWVAEWSRLAAAYVDAGDHYLASLLYGCAKFPCLADGQRAVALTRQVEQYLLASAAFKVHFERRMIDLAYGGENVSVSVHLYADDDDYASRPVVLLSGGVDTWKMDLHRMCLSAVELTGATVLAFDIPGTGELSRFALDGTADELVLGLVGVAKQLGNGKTGHIALSFGANFSALTGLAGVVDAAVDDGGPVVNAFRLEHLSKLPYGMLHIVGNAVGFDELPTADQVADAMAGLSRAELLAQNTNSPMLVVNGADDYFVPQSDTLAFEGRADTEVRLIPETGHVARSKLPEVMPMMLGWLGARLAETEPAE